MKVFLIPFSGGSSLYYNKWSCDKLEFIPLDYAGHGSRMREPLCTSIEQVADDLVNIVKKKINGDDYCIFGHSLGGLVTYEMYQQIQECNIKEPLCLYISGSRTPGMKVEEHIEDLNEDEYKSAVMKLGGVEEEFFLNKKIFETFNPILKNDLVMNEYYRKSPEYGIKCRAVFMNGVEDHTLTLRDLLQWKNYCKNECKFEMFLGAHFYLNTYYNEIIAKILEVTNTCMEETA